MGCTGWSSGWWWVHGGPAHDRASIPGSPATEGTGCQLLRELPSAEWDQCLLKLPSWVPGSSQCQGEADFALGSSWDQTQAHFQGPSFAQQGQLSSRCPAAFPHAPAPGRALAYVTFTRFRSVDPDPRPKVILVLFRTIPGVQVLLRGRQPSALNEPGSALGELCSFSPDPSSSPAMGVTP